MLIGKIKGVTDGGSVILLAVQDCAGESHSVYGEPRLMDLFLAAVLEEAKRAGIHPTEVEIVTEAPGMAEWLGIVSQMDPAVLTSSASMVQ